jgi:hypothetical protein
MIWGESSGVVSPLQFIHGSLSHSIVVGQFLSGNTFEIGYVEDVQVADVNLLFEWYT